MSKHHPHRDESIGFNIAATEIDMSMKPFESGFKTRTSPPKI